MDTLSESTFFKTIVKPLSWLYCKCLKKKRAFVKKHCKKMYADILFEKSFGHKINWKHPRDLNEVINYLEFCTDTKEWSILTDKILVRDYVKGKGLEDILVPLLGIWNDAADIDFDALPQKFVLKCNHDSASTHIIDKGKRIDKAKIIAELNSCLGRKYGDEGNEPHYNRIIPKILAEKYLEQENHLDISSSLIDYKIWCFNGEPDVIWVAYNRNKKYLNHETYDYNWNFMSTFGNDDSFYKLGTGIIPPPKSLDKMLSAARILSQGFPQVRVDFYDIDGSLYFGEMTFTSDAGRMPYFSEIYLKRAGAKIDLSNIRKRRFFE